MNVLAILLLAQNFTIMDFTSILIIVFSFYVLFQTVIQYNYNKKSNIFLVYLMIELTVISTMSFLSEHSFGITKYFIFLYIPTFLFLSPTIYLYIQSLTEKDFKFDKKAKKHFFIPLATIALFLIVNIILMLVFHLKLTKGVALISGIFLYMNAIAIYVIPLVQLVFYGIKIIRKYQSHLSDIKNFFSNTEEVQMSWIKYFIITYIAFMVIFIFITIDIEAIKRLSDTLYYGELLLLIIFIGFFGIKQADIYQKILSKNQNEVYIQTDSTRIVIKQPLEEVVYVEQNTNSTSGLSEAKKTEIKNGLIELFEDEKLFLHPSLNISDLADRLNTNQKYLSLVINDCFNKNFLTFINEYRINEAKKIILSDTSHKYSIEGIGNMAGFNSRSAFFNAFKKTTGMTPSAFKESLTSTP